MDKMEKKPEWLKKPYIANQNQEIVEEILKELNLNTVCNEAMCPNRNECFAKKTATFMLLGDACTRNCRFCNVRHGVSPPVDAAEPERIAKAVARLGLFYVVVTSVTRDDLKDGGAAHFSASVRAIRHASPHTIVEVLIPDFLGIVASLETVAKSKPTVVGHNIETVPALYEAVRPEAKYRRSLDVLSNIKKIDPKIKSKTGLMVGLGETEAQVLSCMDDIREADCDFLTIGQYLAPSKKHYPVACYVHPDQFEKYKIAAEAKGFAFVASAPYVRSSYQAEKAIDL